MIVMIKSLNRPNTGAIMASPNPEESILTLSLEHLFAHYVLDEAEKLFKC